MRKRKRERQRERERKGRSRTVRKVKSNTVKIGKHK
jgi:hypothetical protein